MVKNFKNLMKSQAKAADSIKKRFGTQQALDYLLGEKLYGYLRAFKDDQDVIEALPFFIGEIKKYFDPNEIEDYFSSVSRLDTSKRCDRKKKWDDQEESIHDGFDALIVDKMEELLGLQAL